MLLVNIVRSRAAANEYLIADATGRAPFSPLAETDDARYAALVDLVAARSAGPAFTQRIRSLLDGPQLPAAAALAALAAEMSATDDARIRDLCAEIVAVTERSSPATRVATLLRFAISPALSGLVDPADLLAETLRLDTLPWERADREEVITRLFPVFLAKRPEIALRLLYDAVEENWDHAMALLEHGAKELVNVNIQAGF